MSEDFINLEKKPNDKKDIALSVLVLIVVFAFVFGFVTLREYSARELLSSASQKIVDEVEYMFSVAERTNDGEEDEEEITAIEEEEEREEEEEKTKVYKKTAQRGEGLTHLARKALASYIQEEGVELSAEERVYVEDYVQKRIAPEKTGLRFLDIGEEVEISVELLEEGVASAQELTPAQINNLTQYANLVSF
jgi:hypothetical protein